MADDPFASHASGWGSPATRHYVVDLDSPGPTELDPVPRWLYAMTDGNIEIVDANEVSAIYPVTAGQILPFRATALGSSTTADVAAWY